MHGLFDSRHSFFDSKRGLFDSKPCIFNNQHVEWPNQQGNSPNRRGILPIPKRIRQSHPAILHHRAQQELGVNDSGADLRACPGEPSNSFHRWGIIWQKQSNPHPALSQRERGSRLAEKPSESGWGKKRPSSTVPFLWWEISVESVIRRGFSFERPMTWFRYWCSFLPVPRIVLSFRL